MGCNRCFNLKHLYEHLTRVLRSYRLHATLRAVNRLRFIIVPLLVALWLPASSHVLLEHWELIHQVHADHEPGSEASHEHGPDNHDAADGLCLVPSAKVPLPQPLILALPLGLMVPILSDGRECIGQFPHSGPSPPGTAPPYLSHRWQFSFRTALLPRAPSLIS